MAGMPRWLWIPIAVGVVIWGNFAYHLIGGVIRYLRNHPLRVRRDF